MTRPTYVAIGLSAVAATLSLTIVNSPNLAGAAPMPAMMAPSTDGVALVSVAGLMFGDIPLNWATPARWLGHAVTKPAPHKTWKTYTVRPGDTLSAIAIRFHVDRFNLAADNKIHMYAILTPGEVLKLPRPGEKAHAPMAMQAPTTAAYTSTFTSAAPVQSASPAPAATVAVSGSMSSFEQCVISRESGGNPQVMNGSGHWGLFQFSESTWIAYGGSPGAFGNGSAAVQEQVFANAMARGGQSNWAPYDGC